MSEKETFKFDLEKHGEGDDAIRFQIISSPGETPLSEKAKKMIDDNLAKKIIDENLKKIFKKTKGVFLI